MPSLRVARILGVSCLFSAACFSTLAPAFPAPARPEPVIEFYNVDLGHYFLTIDPADVAAIEAGYAGPGWVKTGLAFTAYRQPFAQETYCPGDCGAPVTRFYGTPGLGPNSHFFTAIQAEVDALRPPGTGWSLEHVAFSIPVPDASGRCAPGLVPIHRLYNNRWRVNDSNHRYVANPAELERMPQGWAYEGVAFCAYQAQEIPIKSLAVAIDLGRKILPSAECEDESLSLGPCLAINNVPVPRSLSLATPPRDFFDWTGLETPFNYVVPGQQAGDVFVQGTASPGTASSTFGIRVSSASRGAWEEVAVNPLYQLRTAREPDGRDLRFFPFGRAEGAVQLRVSWIARVKRIVIGAPGSHAFGHPTLEFTDTKSGRNLYFTMLSYGTVPQDDYLAADLFTGKVIVGTALRPGSPYLRNVGLPSLALPLGFVSPDPSGTGGAFEFRVDRAEFQRVLDAARQLDAAFSADPADYLLDNFHFNNEVYREGGLGLTLADFKLELVRR